MNRKYAKGLLKHGDFILLDLICLQFCYVLSYWINRGFGNPYTKTAYQYQAVVLFASQLVVIVFSNNYRGILRRKFIDESIAIAKYLIQILLLALFYLFVVHHSNPSRMQFGITFVLFFFVDGVIRYLNKQRIFHSSNNIRRKKSLILITGRNLVDQAVEKLTRKDLYQDYMITEIILLDPDDSPEEKYNDIPVKTLSDESLREISHNWVDEVFILQPDTILFPTQLLNKLMKMGITVNYAIAAINDDRWPFTDVRKLGGYKVFTNSIRFASPGDLALKRIMDIIGSIIGCLLTCIIFVFIAPVIYKKSPGPIFFVQERIGKNGKPFKMYKFRSMYLDAEERKQTLLANNEMDSDLMFKMENDPRIIGSEKKNRKGEPAGIGNFIRKTSLDEFPQFFNVLRGDMSLVGWRPATVGEWEKYDLSHRVRASMKPGITGIWQVSGRSDITDFNEVVRMDKEYIENWSLLLDIKIILKTIVVIFSQTGAK